ncbi:uncharacterized protein B0I36DRAFT_380354 [Microdochium trichocladiopsis]|uniref:RING-type E3 ubiquitin transferase n=1 Tax=Microdochium trichocladiopsis TaxID=1682393 RepID=A0A9P8YAH8_9PEZI|nr:uncharacterized protein B0I36DRAFT_380354 [Microdochium trichocladiopsis]KAH7037051.1 hypothetical protein B0I36DRAFT_380354 [Microdochium trichocladiopsis]
MTMALTPATARDAPQPQSPISTTAHAVRRLIWWRRTEEPGLWDAQERARRVSYPPHSNYDEMAMRWAVMQRRTAGGRMARAPKPPHGLPVEQIAQLPLISFHQEDYRNVDHQRQGDDSLQAQSLQQLDTIRDSTDQDSSGSHTVLSQALPTFSKSRQTSSSETAIKASDSGQVVRIKEAVSCQSNSSCSICTEDLIEGEHVRRLPCTHIFHPPCIDHWLRERAPTCPLCRLDLEAFLVHADNLVDE